MGPGRTQGTGRTPLGMALPGVHLGAGLCALSSWLPSGWGWASPIGSLQLGHRQAVTFTAWMHSWGYTVGYYFHRTLL